MTSSAGPSSGALVAGKYRLGQELGRGGMGVVFAARHEILHQNVAIKFLLPEIASDAGFAARFLNEARAAARIRGDHVAAVLDADLGADGVPFMVLEYLEGNTLEHELLLRERLPVSEAARYVIEALDAVAQAHALGIVHRDLKPGNLFLSVRPDGSRSVKLLDFGVSKLRQLVPEAAGEGLTSPNSLLGSPLYMSPEQIHDAASVDARADIWSAGVVLYRAVKGSLPFESKSASMALVSILGQPPSPLGPDFPEGLERAIFRCLEKDSRHRYPTAADLAEALLPFARDQAPLVQRIRGTISRKSAGSTETTLVATGPTSGDVPDTGVRKRLAIADTEPRSGAPRARTPIPGVTVNAAVLVALVALVLAALGLAWLSL